MKTVIVTVKSVSHFAGSFVQISTMTNDQYTVGLNNYGRHPRIGEEIEITYIIRNGRKLTTAWQCFDSALDTLQLHAIIVAKDTKMRDRIMAMAEIDEMIGQEPSALDVDDLCEYLEHTIGDVDRDGDHIIVNLGRHCSYTININD